MKLIFVALPVSVLLATCRQGPLEESNDNVADAYVIAGNVLPGFINECLAA